MIISFNLFLSSKVTRPMDSSVVEVHVVYLSWSWSYFSAVDEFDQHPQKKTLEITSDKSATAITTPYKRDERPF